MISLLLNPANYGGHPLAFAGLVTAAFLVLLAVAVLAREQYSPAGRAFFIMMVPFVVWLTAFACMYAVNDATGALFWARAAYVGVPFIPVGVGYFALVLTGKIRRYWTPLRAATALSIIFSAGFLSSNSFISGIFEYSWGRYPRYGAAGVPFVAYFISALAAVLYVVWASWRESTSVRQRARLRSLIAALVVCYLGVVDYLPKFGIDV